MKFRLLLRLDEGGGLAVTPEGRIYVSTEVEILEDLEVDARGRYKIKEGLSHFSVKEIQEICAALKMLGLLEDDN